MFSKEHLQLHMERYSNGKEPHWKCGVPQGIVRSSRILSATGKRTSQLWGAFLYIRILPFLENPARFPIFPLPGGILLGYDKPIS